MQIPTIKAVDAVKEFTEDLKLRFSLFLCLSEIPIGDEYGVLTPTDHDNWKEFSSFLAAQSVEPWENYPFNSDERKAADKYFSAEYDATEKALKAMMAR